MTLEERLRACARFGMKPGLDTMHGILAALGNPQDRLSVIHVAGTNGKGATCALVDAGLRASGFCTGRYTSPHLVNLNERFFLDGMPVEDALLDAVWSRVAPFVPENITYFELLTAVAFVLYAESGVDCLVLETGLGGRLDATNVVTRPEVCAITRIGLDHCDWLGHTFAEIAAEKAGIVKPGVPVVCGTTPPEARAVIERIACDRGSTFVYAPDAVGADEIPAELALGGSFNRENALTALAVLKSFPGVDVDRAKRGFSQVVWPGRYQRVGGFLVDGAHNPPAMRALVDAVKADPAFADRLPFSVMCGFCGDKDVRANLRILREIADHGFAVTIANPRSLPAVETARLMTETGMNARACSSVREALDLSAGMGAVVCGSLFLAGEALVALGAYPYSVRRPVPNETGVGRHGEEAASARRDGKGAGT